MKIRIGARRSHLARLQAYLVGDALQKAAPGLAIEYSFKESLGDKNLQDPLWKLPERGVFTEDFVQDLHEGKVDLVVHSWKDLPTEERPGLALLGTLPRADARDLFFLRRESFGKENLTLLTSSPRRTFSATRELPKLLPFPVRGLETKSVRGNVHTRLRKLVEGEGDGLFMAKAALDRLLSAEREDFQGSKEEIRGYLHHLQWMVLPLTYFPTAPAQGALAIEGKAGRADLAQLVKKIHCEQSAAAVQAERERFAAYGGGCHQKIGLTVAPHPRLGNLEFFYGELSSGEVLHSIRAEKSPAPRHNEERWPLEPGPAFFARAPLAARHPGTDLFVARADALPEWELGEELIWAAGLDTWKKLARRGVWVNGSSEGLGESEPEVQALAGRPLSFTKLTHERSGNRATFPTLATYTLRPRPFTLPRAKSYFWMSETSFLRALELDPSIREARHASGPGYTAEAIERVLGKPVAVYINYRHWRNGDPLA
jgi:hydroxymethylbilane synthase